MNRRQFIIGSFMAGVLAAVGIKPRPEALIYFKPGDYMKTAEFTTEGLHTVYYVGQSVSCPDVNRLKIEGDVELTIVMRPAPSC